VAALLQHPDHLAGGGLLVVLVQRHQPGGDPEGVEQLLAVPGVLGGHRVDGLQHRQRAQAHVLKISQRRGHHIQ
jgi:hypothetical protein